MSQQLSGLWVYLAASPLLGLTLTLLAYQGGVWLHRRANSHPLANPVLTAIALVATLLWATDTSYARYFDGAQFVHFLLGPATVALAIPLFTHFRRVKAMAGPLLTALVLGSIAAMGSAMLIAWLLGASPATVLSLAPKSVTTPIGMAVAERIGGLPSLTAVLVILTGILGAIAARDLYRLLGIRDPAAQGLAMGVAAHGIGTARAFQMGEQIGAFSALAMGINGALTALVLPYAAPLLHTWLH